jgi:hypothetical protein
MRKVKCVGVTPNSCADESGHHESEAVKSKTSPELWGWPDRYWPKLPNANGVTDSEIIRRFRRLTEITTPQDDFADCPDLLLVLFGMLVAQPTASVVRHPDSA